MRHTGTCLGAATAVFSLLFAGFAWAAPVTLSGTVTNAQTGLPLTGIAVGATRVAELAGGDPGAPIVVEATAITTTGGAFSYTVDDSNPGLDRVLLFTMSPSYHGLEAGVFRFPADTTEAKEISAPDLGLILEGIDLCSVKRQKRLRCLRKCV